MKYSLGSYLKGLRKERKLSQKDVERDGILNQSQLSKIEQDEQIPNFRQIIHLSDVFNIELDDIKPYVEDVFYPDANQKYEKMKITKEIRDSVRFHQYHELGPKIDDIKNSPLFKKPLERQFIDWHLGIYEHEHNKDIEKGFYFINLAIHSTISKVYRKQYIEILNSKGAFHISNNQSEKALPSLLEAQKIIKHLHNQIDHKVSTRILYNLSILSYQQENYKASIRYLQLAEKILKENESSYLNGEIYFQFGLNYYWLNNLEESREKMLEAESFFKRNRQEKHLLYVCETIEKYKLK